MERAPFPDSFPEDWRKFVQDNIFDQASGVPTILTTEPTTANGVLKEGQRGLYNNAVYEMVNGTVLKYTVTVM